MAAKHQKIKVELPSDLEPDQVEEVADLIVERIVERTIQGKDKNGKPWSGKAAVYSDSYKNSLDYKVSGKSGNVDLQLSGDMLAALQILKVQQNNKVEIGFEKGSDENARADGNIRGTYGRPTPIPGKKRDFLGISDKELRKIIRYVKSQSKLF
jgi:hypothetical protein